MIWTVVVVSDVHRYLFEDVIDMEHCNRNKAGVGFGSNLCVVQVRGFEHRKDSRWRRWSSTIGE